MQVIIDLTYYLVDNLPFGLPMSARPCSLLAETWVPGHLAFCVFVSSKTLSMISKVPCELTMAFWNIH